MFEYALSKVNKLGEHDEKYGTTYWGEVGQDKPIKFNSMQRDISDGAKITAEERTEKQSQKGTVYYQLRKVKLVERGVITEADVKKNSVPAQAPVGRDAEMYQMIKEIHKVVVPPEDALGGDNVTDEIDLSDIPI